MLTPAQPYSPTMRKPLRKLFLVFFVFQLTAFSAVGALVLAVQGMHQHLAHELAIDHQQHGLAEIDTRGHEEHALHQHGCDGLHSIGILASSTLTLVTLGSRPFESTNPKMPPDRFSGPLYRPPRTLL